MELVFGVEGDYDAGEVSVDEAEQRLHAAGVKAVIYTTASHTPERPRWRVLAPLSGPVEPSRRAHYVSLLNDALGGGILAPESWVLSQVHYIGQVAGVAYEARVIEGEATLDVLGGAGLLVPLVPARRAAVAKVIAKPRAARDVNDPAVDYLEREGWVTGYGDGIVHVRCPWEAEHTTQSEPSATSYIPAGVGGEMLGGFKCFHSHCAGRVAFDFLRAVGYDDPAHEFEVVALTPEEERVSAAARERNKSKPGRVALDDFYAHGPSHKYIYRPTRELWPAASVDWMVGPWPKPPDGKKAMAPSKWLDANRPVHQMTWAPGEPEIVEGRVMGSSGWEPHANNRVFNKYVPPPPTRGDAARAGPWLDHVRKVFPDDAEHLVQWFAHRVQRPGEKVNHALVLGGAPGVGKDSILVPVKVAVGGSNVSDISPGNLLGQFNGWAASVVTVISEARDLGESDRFKFYEASKAVLAAPPDVIRVNEKHVPEFNVPNLVGVVVTTNHRTSGLYLPADDRRHYVAWSEATRDEFDEGYWPRLYGWYASGGIGHVVAYLRGVDLSGFDAKAPPRKTPAFWAMVAAGEAPESSELRSVLEALGDPAATTLADISVKASQLSLHALAAELPDRRGRARAAHMLDRVGYVSVRNPDAKDGRFGKTAVYARAALSIADRIKAAREFERLSRPAADSGVGGADADAADIA